MNKLSSIFLVVIITSRMVLIKCQSGLPKDGSAPSNSSHSGGGGDCEGVNYYSEWKDQIPIRSCHYTTHTHPRQEERYARKSNETQLFEWLGLFNILYDMDFVEVGGMCSVKLHQEWLTGEKPQDLREFSFTRVWYKRLCNFFSFLECIPQDEYRQRRFSKEPVYEKSSEEQYLEDHKDHFHAGGLPDKHNHLEPDVIIPEPEQPDTQDPPLDYKDSGRDTTGLTKLKIGGRGPGRGRLKSGAGTDRVTLKSQPLPKVIDEYPIDGYCACHANDPKYPDRKLVDYGIDFVEDHDRSRAGWCVAAPANLCGRVYFRSNLWPGQNFEFSDHIPCPKLYNGDEYECVQWFQSVSDDAQADFQPFPKSRTATCEKKKKDADTKLKKKKKKKKSAGNFSADPSVFLIFILGALIQY